MGNCEPSRLRFLDVKLANLGGFSVFPGSWGAWLSAVWLSVSLCVCVICPCVFVKCILGATLALHLSVQRGSLFCLSLSGVSLLCTGQTDRHTHPNRKQTGNAQLRMQHEIFVPCAGRESAVRIFAFPTFPDPQSLFHSIRLPLMSYVLSTVASNPITL